MHDLIDGFIDNDVNEIHGLPPHLENFFKEIYGNILETKVFKELSHTLNALFIKAIFDYKTDEETLDFGCGANPMDGETEWLVNDYLSDYRALKKSWDEEIPDYSPKIIVVHRPPVNIVNQSQIEDSSDLPEIKTPRIQFDEDLNDISIHDF